ncbi:hypothetical protein [Vibrio spartinae]|uniref:Uncharacterized protein n=1 Tax=Vibrio spartinae TaxID=1918945 RepID=A0A1N6M9I2_9VIBR|nr:hypothetical protein [Vibrio spartinae]SIO96099.1 hypothetical protein VSP9026_03859 [Vibrio spartinae]
MTVISAPSMHDQLYVGTHGNVSVAKSKVTLLGAAVGDVIEMLDIPIGIEFIGLRIATSGLGEGVMADIRLGEILLAEDVDLSGEYSQSINCEAYTREKQKLTVTLKGDSATGTLQIRPEYIATGY